MQLTTVDSSMLFAVGYDAEAQKLYAVFYKGIWCFEKVPQEVYDKLIASSSVGSYMRGNVLGLYREYQITTNNWQ